MLLLDFWPSTRFSLLLSLPKRFAFAILVPVAQRGIPLLLMFTIVVFNFS